MKILSFVFFALQTIWEANCLKCHVNAKGAEPKETECKAEEKYCMFKKEGTDNIRACSPEVDNAKHGCVKSEMMDMKSLECYCQTDNCNNMCKAGKCEKMPVPKSRKQLPILDITVDPSSISIEKCEVDCRTDGGGGDATVEPAKPSDDPAKPTDKKPDGDGTKKPEETGETKAEGKPDGESTKDPKEAEGTKAGACLGCNQSFGNLFAMLTASAMLASICNS